MENAGLGQIEIAERKLAQRGVDQRVDHGAAAAFVEKDLIAGEHVAGPQRRGGRSGGLHLGHEAIRRGEAAEFARRRP